MCIFERCFLSFEIVTHSLFLNPFCMNRICRLLLIIPAFLLMGNVVAQVKLTADFTDVNSKKEVLHDMWSVANRISPQNGAGVRDGIKVNLVRMIGGVSNTVDGVRVPNPAFDPCVFDSVNQVYVYNWEPLKSRLNAILNSNDVIHQLVVDQPPWCFQHGYTFLPDGSEYDGVHFKEEDRYTIYGNCLPPYDKQAYYDFIVAMMNELVATYGKETVLSWRLRVGSEIETPDHWRGTKQDFIDHYANTVRAILSVLPNAVVGLHTRQPNFLYKNGTIKNYKGEAFASFIPDLIAFCYDNDDVRYDFWGISDYILINNKSFRDISAKYSKDFAPLIDHPKWNSDATIEYHEYNVVTTMTSPDGGTLSCVTSHDQTYQVALSQLFYDKNSKGLNEIFRWAQRPSSKEEISVELVNTMLGKNRYSHVKAGTPTISTNIINATFAKDEQTHQYDILAYNYNANSLDYKASESVKLSFVTDLPVGTQLFYRDLSYGEAQNKLQMFMKNEPSSGWIKSGYDWKGDPTRTLNEAGQLAWNSFVNPNKTEWSMWKSITTEAPTSGMGSVINIATKLSSFSFQKFEIKGVEELSSAIAPAQSKVQLTSSDDFRQFKPYTGAGGSYQSITIENDTMQLVMNNNYPRITIKPDMDYKSYDKFRIVIKNGSSSSIFNVKWNSDGVEKSLTYKDIITTNDTEFNSYTIDVGANAAWKGEITDVQLWGPNRAIDGVVVIDTMEFFASNPTIDSVSIATTQGGFVNYTSGTCLRGQEFELLATSIGGYQFTGWTGDVASAANPYVLRTNGDTKITANFAETFALNTQAVNGSVAKSPDSDEYVKGTEVELIATPNAGYEFSGWSGDVTGVNDTINVTMDSTINLIANFELIPRYMLTLNSENGAVNISPDMGDYERGTAIELTATPNTGYAFSAWSGDVSATSNPLSITMDSSMTITAEYTTVSSINENTTLDFTVSPNPSESGIFTLSRSSQWVIFYLSGSEMLRGEGTQINLSSFDKGLYLLKTPQGTVKLIY